MYSFLRFLISDSGRPSIIALIQRRSNSSTSFLCILDTSFFFYLWLGNLHSNKNYSFLRQIWGVARPLNNQCRQALTYQYSCSGLFRLYLNKPLAIRLCLYRVPMLLLQESLCYRPFQLYFFDWF